MAGRKQRLDVGPVPFVGIYCRMGGQDRQRPWRDLGRSSGGAGRGRGEFAYSWVAMGPLWRGGVA